MSATTSPPPAPQLTAERVVGPRRRRSFADLEEVLDRRWVTVVALVLLTLLAVAARYRAVAAALWLDEAQAVNIAHHPIGQIPHLLKLDGSPPLYYVLLHAWMAVVGDTETRVHWLSIGFAALCVPVGWVGARLASGTRAAWLAAVLLTFNSFLSGYADQARMYTLLALLVLLAVAAFLAAYVHRRRAFIPVFSVALVACLYTHNWAFFAAFGFAVAVAVLWWTQDRDRRILVDAALGFGLVVVLYAPWLPQLLYQVGHTGAPWSTHPTTRQYLLALGQAVGGSGTSMLLLLGGGAGLAAVLRRERSTTRSSVLALLGLTVTSLVLSYAFCKLSLAFAPRYFAIFVGPLTVLAAVGFALVGRMGLVATGLCVLLMFGVPPGSDLDKKTNVAVLSRYMSRYMHAGDLVVSTQPEQIPTLVRYLRPGLHYATPYNVLADPTIMDWRNVSSRMRTATVQRNLTPLVNALPVGAHVLIVDQVTDPNTKHKSSWYRLVRDRKLQWLGALQSDPRLRRTTSYKHHLDANIAVATAVLFTKVHA